MEQKGGYARLRDKPRYGLALNARMLTVFSLGFLVALGLAEYLNHYVSTSWGFTFYLLVLFSLILVAALTKERALKGFWLALGLAPLIRIVSLATPVMLTISQYVWYVVISIPIIAAVVTVARANRFSLEDIGLNFEDPIVQILVGVSGMGLAAGAYFVLRPAAWTAALTFQSTLFPALVLLLFTGLVEELVFRGVMQKAAGALGPYGWIYVAAVYAILQIQQGSFLYCLVAMLGGLYFGYMVRKTKSIAGVALAHGILNISLYLIFPHIITI